jgi:hypothetical protein
VFKTTISLFDDYYRHLDASKAPGFNLNLGCEVRKRLEQLEFIIGKVRRLEVEAAEPLARFKAEFQEHALIVHKHDGQANAPVLPPLTQITPEEFSAYHRAQFEMELLTEAFYYFAGRIRTIIKSPEKPLPGLGAFECVGVRNTRNKLLEHAEGRDSRVHMIGFGWGAACGPVIKAIRQSEQVDVFPDKGLYLNAEEFRANLVRVLQTSLGRA